MDEKLNSQSLDTLCAALAYAMGIEAPSAAAPACEKLTAYIDKTLGGRKADRVFMYNTDAIAEWIYKKYNDFFTEAVAAALRKGDHLAARKGALALLEEPTLPVAFIPRAERLAGEANVAWLLDPKPGEGKVEVTVSSGDTPGRLAGRCGVSTALLMRVNGLKDPRKLRLGQKLILPERPAFSWDAPEEERVVLRLGGRFFKSYRIVPGGQGNRLWIDTPKGREAVAFASVDELAEARLIWRR